MYDTVDCIVFTLYFLEYMNHFTFICDIGLIVIYLRTAFFYFFRASIFLLFPFSMLICCSERPMRINWTFSFDDKYLAISNPSPPIPPVITYTPFFLMLIFLPELRISLQSGALERIYAGLCKRQALTVFELISNKMLSAIRF